MIDNHNQSWELLKIFVDYLEENEHEWKKRKERREEEEKKKERLEKSKVKKQRRNTCRRR